MNVGIVGPGRAGLGLGLALAEAGHRVRLHGRRRKPVPPPLAVSWGGPPAWGAEVDVVLVAVRDDDVSGVAETMAAAGWVSAAHVVLHLSGLLDHTALAALAPSGCGRGSLHPLQAISDPERAPERLRGALAAVEGDDRAVACATALARDLGLVPVPLAPGQKTRYHAGAVIASNYLVVLEAAAERLFTEAGVDARAARAGIARLMEGTLANAAADGAAALTGPIVRGDVGTVERHLAALPSDVADLYRAVGRAALALTDLPEDTRARLRGLLR